MLIILLRLDYSSTIKTYMMQQVSIVSNEQKCVRDTVL